MMDLNRRQNPLYARNHLRMVLPLLFGFIFISGRVNSKGASVESRSNRENDYSSLFSSKQEKVVEEYRQDVRWGIDDSAQTANKTPKVTTISEIVALVRPWDYPVDGTPEKYGEGRISGFERTIWQVTATVIKVELKKNGDIWMVLEDKPGERIIAYSPQLDLTDPDVKKSAFTAQICKIHELLSKEFHPSNLVSEIKTKITIEGFGYFGHALMGSKFQNGARIEPILAIKFVN